MIRPAIVFLLLALVPLAGCVTAGKPGKGVDKAAPITPVIDPGARKAALAELPQNERSRYCRSTARRVGLSVEAHIMGRQLYPFLDKLRGMRPA